MNLAITTSALLLGAFTISAQAQTQTKPAGKPYVNQAMTAPTTGSFFGGGDDCAAADVIAGTGTFNYDTTAATTGTQGQNESNCYKFGTSGVGTDVWFDWTADFTGTATVSMCTGGVPDTKIAAYPGGGCPADGTSLACNDDTCGLLSEIAFPVVSGATYSLQIGTFPGGSASAGTFDISGGGGGGCTPTTAQDDCATPHPIAGQGCFDYDTTAATTGTQGQNESSCYKFGTSGVGTDVWFAWTSDATGTATVTLCTGGAPDTKLAAYPGSSCPTDGSALACNDDTCGLLSEVSFAATAGSTYMIQLGTFPGGSTSAGTFDINVDGPAEPGTSYCVAAANSVSADGSRMSASGSNSISAANLTLNADNAPNQPAIFYHGPNQTNFAFGNGIRCVGGQVVRMPPIVGSGGNFSIAVDFNAFWGQFAVGPRNFQCWYRDPAGGGAFFNLSDGYEIVFLP